MTETTEKKKEEDVRWAMFTGGLRGLYWVILTTAIVVFVIILALVLVGAFRIRDLLNSVLNLTSFLSVVLTV